MMKKLLLLLFMFTTLIQASETLKLTGTLRDFNQSHIDFEPHMSWENGLYPMDYFTDGVRGGLITGYVLDDLDADRKPQINPSSTHALKPKSFHDWYHDTSANMSMPYSIELQEISGGAYQFSSNSFFPADGKLFGQEIYHGQMASTYHHNFHMTYEIHTKFTYQNGQVFNFEGDDDVWVFINNKLVVDLGGLHSSEAGSVNLDTLGLIEGESYNFDFFWAERHTTGSNFTITTTVKLESKPADLIADYHFDTCVMDSEEGTIKDSSGNHLNGTKYGAVRANRSDVINREANFDGHGSIRVPHNELLNPDKITVMAWVKPQSFQDWSSVVINSTTRNWADGWGMAHYNGSNDINFYVGHYNSGKASATLEMDTYSHVVGTYDGKNVKIYVNGKLINSRAVDPSTIKKSEGMLNIGRGWDDNGKWDGSIDEVKIYKGALSTEQIKAIYDNEKAHKNADGSARETLSCGIAFTCDDTMYFSNASPMGTPEGEDDSKMWLHKINREQTPFSFDAIGEPFEQIKVERSDGSHYNVYNALAYNPVDNFMYALVENELVKIDSVGMVDVLGVVEGLPKCDAHGNYYSGSFGAIEEGGKSYFYITSGLDSDIYKVDVDEQKVVEKIVATEGIYAWDVAADTSGNYLYYIDRESYADNNNQLRRVKIQGEDKGKVEYIGPKYPHDGQVDVIFCDASDKLYVLYHDKGFYEVDKETGKRTAISNAPVTASLNDAAMCPLATVDLLPLIHIGNGQVMEGDSGTTDLVFPITYSGGSGTDVTFDYVTVDGNSTNEKINASSEDYISVNASGNGTGITIKVKGDTLEESDEQFFVRLSNVQGALYHDSALIGTGTIVDNDREQTAFMCEANSYIFTSGPTADYTKAMNINFLDDKIETLREKFNEQSEENIRGSHINGIGYNVQDNYIYGWEWDAAGCSNWTCSNRDTNNYNPGLVKIDKDFNIQRIAIEGFDEKKPLFAGDVSLDGKYYVSGSAPGGENTVTAADRIYVIDLNERKLERTLMLSHPVKMADFAFNPMDKKIYTIESWSDNEGGHYDLVRITTKDEPGKQAGTVERLGDVRSDENKITNAYTNVTFFDREGYFYFYTAGDDIDAVFKIDISKPEEPINTNATMYNEITLAGGGDGARCSLAPIENVYDINITNSSAFEGDSGYSDMNVTVTLDRAVSEESGLSIGYKLISGTEKIDASKKEGSFTIPSGVTSYTASLPVISGDVFVEENKDFTIHLSIQGDPRYKDKNVTTVDGHKVEIKFVTNDVTGLVLDDDACTFAAWDAEGASLEDQKIHTKIVNGNIVLNIALLDSHNNLFDKVTQMIGGILGLSKDGGVSETKLRLVDVSAANDPCSSGVGSEELNQDPSFTAFSMGESSLITYTLPANQARLMKQARIQFSWKDKIGWKTTCSKDTFAIRPNRYDLGIPSNLVAGKEFQVTISAKDAQGHVITDYTEAAGVYQLDINETNSSCSLGTISKTKSNFLLGISTVKVKYSDIGALDFKVREKNASNTEFAHIDAEDTVSRFISPDSEASVEVKPAKITLDSAFSNKGLTYGGSNYTFYADNSEIKDMSVALKTIVRVLNENDQVVKNFKSGCYAKDVDVNMLYTLSGSTVQANMDVNYTNTNNGALAQAANALHVPTNGSQQTYTYKIDKSLFVDGVGTQSILMNFQRAVNNEKNPMGFNVGEVNASVEGLDAAPSVSVGSTIFMYGRAHVPSPQTFVGRDHNITVSYEVYCDEDNGCNRATYPGFAGLVESEDAVSWFKLNGFSALSTFEMDYASPKALYSHSSCSANGPSASEQGVASPSRTSSDIMHIQITGSLPHRDKIVYDPAHSYLVFNPANPNATSHSFKMTAMPNSQNWLGKGDLGSAVDDKTSVGNGLQKLDW